MAQTLTEEQKKTDAARNKVYRIANPITEERKRQKAEVSRQWRLANPGRQAKSSRAWRLANPGKDAAYGAAYKRQNPDKSAASTARRRAAKARATPLWANIEAINAIYNKTQSCTEMTGIPCHVDHIVPLRSKIVCGLHCEDNLQILPGADNTSKGNRHWPDMPGEENALA